jgi:nitrite reductase/ring-hydroxylating ferredoxin subunit
MGRFHASFAALDRGHLAGQFAPSQRARRAAGRAGALDGTLARGLVSQRWAAGPLAQGVRPTGGICMTETVVRVCAQSDIAPESVKAFEVGDLRLAVYNIEGTFYVTDDECTHAAASLAEGMLEGDVIECSLHFGAFNIKTGEVVQPPCSIPLRTYQVVLQGDDIFVDLEKNAAGEPA